MMSVFTQIIILIICIFLIKSSYAYTKVILAHNLQPGQTYNSISYKFNIYCYDGKPKYLIYLWQSVILNINHPNNDFTQYDGPTPEIVEQEYNDKHSSYSLFNIFTTNKQKTLKLNPFNSSCIGIYSDQPYSVHLHLIKIDLWKVLYLIVGIFLFISSEKLCNNTLFYYISGVTFGICASFLILIYFISKLFPRKPFMYGVLGCGWTIIIYILQILWENTRTILYNYKTYVLWYITVSGLISFILCYRWGPVENQRTKNLIRWSLQLFALYMIYLSSDYQEAVMGQIVILLLVYNLPENVRSLPKTYWHKKFPPKVQFITNDEYYRQGVEETTKALQQLREFCSSPDCNQWKMALKLKDVKRFASFIEGNSHLSDEEILEYETSIQGDLTDDEIAEFSEDETF